MMPKKTASEQHLDTMRREEARLGKRAKWLPEAGTVIPIHLPQEIVRGEILRYLDEDTIEAILNVMPPLAKSHTYRFRQKVIVHRARAEPMGEKWATEDVLDAA